MNPEYSYGSLRDIRNADIADMKEALARDLQRLSGLRPDDAAYQDGLDDAARAAGLTVEVEKRYTW